MEIATEDNAGVLQEEKLVASFEFDFLLEQSGGFALEQSEFVTGEAWWWLQVSFQVLFAVVERIKEVTLTLVELLLVIF